MSHFFELSIAKHVASQIMDVRNVYVAMYGDSSKWGLDIEDVFFINCDVNIMHYLEYNHVKVHESCKMFGISFGVVVIIKLIKQKFLEKYGPITSCILQETMYNILYEHIYDFIVNGENNAY